MKVKSTVESLLAEAQALLTGMPAIRGTTQNHAAVERWRIATIVHLKEAHGDDSEYYKAFAKLKMSTRSDVLQGIRILEASTLTVESAEVHSLQKDQPPFDVVIVCALHKPELEKVLSIGPSWARLAAFPNDPHTYHETHFSKIGGAPLRVVASAPNQMGLSSSSVLATKMILRFQPKLVALVGIAAGAHEGKQGFGDILTADHTFDYGAGKLKQAENQATQIEFLPDPKPIPINVRLLSRLREWERERTLLDEIQRKWPASSPRTRLNLHIGPLGSGAAVVDAQTTITEISRHWRKLIGIEMEAFGVHTACREARDPEPMFLCLKSICDFAYGKNDNWQDYAAYTAAAACYHFVVNEWQNLFPE